jgi:TRAP-type mannitol/chloroaromatic compound transport system substrate-binding protein
MQRRQFLKAAGAGATLAAAPIAAPAIAQGIVKWRLATSFPKNLDTLFGAMELFSKRIETMSEGKFQIQLFAPGEVVGALQVVDAVRDGTIEAGHTAGYYYFGKDPTFAFDTAMPFGLNTRQQAAWMTHGGGMELMREFFRDYNIVNFICGNTGAQMGGWFRKEIKKVEDLKGLKYRIGGFAGAVVSRLGVVPQQIAGGDIYSALEKGTIDAAEWVGPYDDEKLGFQKVAKYYYYPGWWEGAAQISIYANSNAYNALSNEFKAMIEAAAAEANNWMLAKYDAQNPAALRRLVAGGALIRPFSREILQACHTTARELYEETAAKNPRFKKVYEPWSKFLAEQNLWFRVAEFSFDNYMMNQQPKKS